MPLITGKPWKTRHSALTKLRVAPLSVHAMMRQGACMARSGLTGAVEKWAVMAVVVR